MCPPLAVWMVGSLFFIKFPTVSIPVRPLPFFPSRSSFSSSRFDFSPFSDLDFSFGSSDSFFAPIIEFWVSFFDSSPEEPLRRDETPSPGDFFGLFLNKFAFLSCPTSCPKFLSSFFLISASPASMDSLSFVNWALSASFFFSSAERSPCSWPVELGVTAPIEEPPMAPPMSFSMITARRGLEGSTAPMLSLLT